MLFKTLLVIILSVSGVLSQGGWGVTYTPERICALEGSSVDMRCSYSYPTYYIYNYRSYYCTVQKTFWFIAENWNSIEGEDLLQVPQYSHRVEYLGNMNNDCTFRIKLLKESDSELYRFRFLTDREDGEYTGGPGVLLTVTGLQVKVTENEGQSITLTCSSTCTLSDSPTFTWYKNGKVVPHEYKYSLNLASTDDTDLFSCATGGVTSPAVNVKCVKVAITSSTVREGEMVTLTCKITCTDLTGSQSFIWYKNGQFIQNTQEYLVFKSSSGDTGSYSCAVRGHENLPSATVTLCVRCVNVEMSSTVSLGDWLRLTCELCTDLTGSPTFIWSKNGLFIENTAQKYQYHNYLQFQASSGDTGSYSCAVRGHENLPSPAVTLYPPKSPSVSVSPSGEIVEGSSVTLTCSSDANPPVQRYTWYRKTGSSLSQRGTERSYTIKNITLQDAGEYICQAVNRIGTNISPRKRLDVQYSPKHTSVSVSRSGEIVEGSSVTLTCSSDANPPVRSYTWFKNDRAVSSETGGPDDSYTIKNIILQDAGEYYCEADNAIGTNRSPPKRLDVQYAPKTSVSVSPSGEIVEASSVTLTCSSDANPPVQNYTWFKKNDTGVWQAGSGQSLKFSNFRSWNSGQYYCESQNRHGAQNASALLVTVQGGQSLIVAAAVGVAAILALVFLGVLCVRTIRRRKSTNVTEGGRQGGRDEDTYAGLQLPNISPDYDVLQGGRDGDTYAGLQLHNISPDYDVLQKDTVTAQEAKDEYEN